MDTLFGTDTGIPSGWRRGMAYGTHCSDLEQITEKFLSSVFKPKIMKGFTDVLITAGRHLDSEV